MKKQYNNPEVEVIMFECEDILQASGTMDRTGILDIQNPIKWFNE